MSYRFVQYPRKVTPAEYDAAIDRMVKKLSAYKGVVSVSQIGGISTPGISDIDFYVVFEDDAKLIENPVTGISPDDSYLFTHNLFGTSVKFARGMEQYTFFGAYRHLAGSAFISQNETSGEDIGILKTQVALEYLIKAWITVNIEKSYGVIKIRNLFLYAKALVHDLAFLNTGSGKLWDIVHEIINLRNSWFQNPVPDAVLSDLINSYAKELSAFLESALNAHRFYLPKNANHQVGRNIFLRKDTQVNIKHEGLRLPPWISAMHQKLFNLQNRMNKFNAGMPVEREQIPGVVLKRFHWIASAVQYNKINLPGFVPTAYGMNIFSNSTD